VPDVRRRLFQKTKPSTSLISGTALSLNVKKGPTFQGSVYGYFHPTPTGGCVPIATDNLESPAHGSKEFTLISVHERGNRELYAAS